jgi:hypothetical protein
MYLDLSMAPRLFSADNIKASVALSLDFAREGHYGRGTDTLQGLHSLLEKVLPLSPRLRSTLATVKSLKSLYETLQRQGLYGELHSIKILDELRSYEVHTHGHIATVALLEKRIQEILSLVCQHGTKEIFRDGLN